MTDQKQEKPKQPNWLIKASGDAFLAGGASGLGALVFGVPSEYIVRVTVAGAAYSLWISWKHSKDKDKPKKKTNRSIPFNLGEKGRIDLEYSLSQGGTFYRETVVQALWRKVKGNNRPTSELVKQIDKPAMLSDFIFHSYAGNTYIQLRQADVELFLGRAWKLRKSGRGISTNEWIRRFSQCPMWYRELPPGWYHAMKNLLYDAQKFTYYQIIVTLDNQQSFLTIEPYQLIRILRWYEIERRKI